MKKILLILSLMLSTVLGFTQETCGFDKLLASVLQDSTSKSNFDSVLIYIRKQVALNNGSRLGSGNSTQGVVQPNNYVIPVVFHLVGTNAAALTDAYVQAQLNLLNQGFANMLGSSSTVADDAQIQFCLAQTLPNGQPWANISTYNTNLYYNGTAGITRCTTSVANTVSNNHSMEATGPNSQQALTNVVYFNPANYFNIWVVNSISESQTPYVNQVVGYSPFPLMSGPPNQFLDGVVMRLDGFGINSGGPHYNQGRTLIHETGHYVGLFHTFQFGCSEVTSGNPCNADGDECCDTPPVAVANQNDCNVLSATPPNSCNESPDLPDMYQNHMDYAYDNVNTCRTTFTNDQAVRMHGTIQLYRSNLVSYSNLLATGIGCLPAGLNPTFVTNLPGGSIQFCTSQNYGFISGPGATSYNWTFNGGTPSSSTVQNPTNIQWATPGVYNVSLQVTDGSGNTLSSTIQVFVGTCTPYSGNKANWYFGYYCSLNFSTGMAVPQTPSSIRSLETSAAISDATGNLLFYTDGRTVWNNTHAVMTNGNNTLNGSPNSTCVSQLSAAKGVVIVPKPSTTNHYFIYTLSDAILGPCSTTFNYGVSQYEVDMSTALGTVVSTTPVNPTQNYAMQEGLLTIPHCNGTDYWLIAKPVNNNQTGLANPGPFTNSNTFFASYLVTSAGVSNIPILSSSGTFVSPATSSGGNTWIGQSSISPNKKLFAYVDIDFQKCYIYDFDCSSGILNYLTSFSNCAGYGVSFSPNSKVLYMLTSSSKIRQYDISNLSACNTNPPFVDFDFVPAGTPSNQVPFSLTTMQLGPDGRLYLSVDAPPTSPQQQVAVINFPNTLNTSATSNDCGYNYNGVILLAGQACKLGLPNDIDGIIGSLPDDFSFCLENCGQACFTNLGCGTSFTWNFGDGNTITGANGAIPAGTNGGTTTGNFEYPCHTYAGPGNYAITLSIDGHPVVTHNVNIVVPAIPTITGPNPVCTGASLPQSYFAPSGYNYAWTATNASPTSGNLQTFNVNWTAFPATLNLTVTDPSNGCSASNSITITQTSTPPTVNAGPDVTICPPQTTQLNGTVSNGSVSWSPATGLSCTTCLNPIANPATSTTYVLTATNGCGSSTDQVVVNVGCNLCTTCPNTLSGTISSSPAVNQVYCINSNITISGNVSFNSSEFKIAPNVIITVPAGSTLNINGSHLYSCSDMWQGIVVQPGGVLNIEPYYLTINIPPFIHISLLLHTSLIEDAITGVKVANSTLNTNILTVNSTIFNRCYTSIGVGNYVPTVNTTYPYTIVNSVFTSRDISFTPGSFNWPLISNVQAANNPTTSPLQSPYINNTTYSSSSANAYLKNPYVGQKPQYGIYLQNVGATLNPQTTPTYYEIQIGAAGTTANANYNIFDNLIYDINANEANFTCINNIFQNPAQYGTFNNLGGYGIYATGYVKAIPTLYRLQVIPGASNGTYNNKFYNLAYAINSSNYFEHNMQYCDVRSSSHSNVGAPGLTLTSLGNYGFYMSTNIYRQIEVLHNTFYNVGNAVTLNAVFGPYVVGSLTSNGQYSGQVDINNNTIQPQVTGYPITTQYVGTAIIAQTIVSSGILNPLPSTVINVNNNTITKVYRGIYCANWLKKTVINNANTITLTNDPYVPVFPPGSHPTQYGINHSNNASPLISPNGTAIYDNNITGSNITNPLMYGVYTSLCNNEYIGCNTTTNSYNGLSFNGAEPGTINKGNSMSNHYYGFVLNNNAIIGQQGTSTAPMDDRWTGSWGTPHYKTATLGGSSAINSIMYVRNSTAYNPNGSGIAVLPSVMGTDNYYYSGSTGTILYGSGSLVSCPGNNPNPTNASARLRNLLERIVQNLIPVTNNVAQTRFISKNQVYRAIKNDTTLMDSSVVLKNFYAQSQDSSRQTFYVADSSLGVADIATAQTKVNSLVPQNNIENNYKGFYGTYINYQNDSILSASDSSSLVALAQRCPFTDGAVVYMARALYNAVYQNADYFNDNCVSQNSDSRLASVTNDNNSGIMMQNFDALLYPNPNESGNVYMATEGLSEGNVKIKVTDMQGRIIREITLTVSENISNINLEGINNGVYFVHITNMATGEQIVKKLTIQY